MTGWLQLSNQQRKAAIDEAEQMSGITAKAIEKDWWVTICLKALFQTSFRKHIVFKGGTSLSKCWNLISRFSEDIDIALDPQAFQCEYIERPSKSYVKRLKRKGCIFTTTVLLPELERQLIALGVPAGMITMEAAAVPEDMPDTDPQLLLLHYPSLFDANAYIVDCVKIEVSVRSKLVPFTTVAVQSLLHSIIPRPAYVETAFPLTVVEPHKTFLEKMFLLHEAFRKPDKSMIRTQRMSRHLYDLFKMMDTQIGAAALKDHELYDTLVRHRQWYNNIAWLDYASLSHKTLSFLPTPDVFDDYRQDYATMQEQMIYDTSAPFTEVITKLKLMQGKLRLRQAQHTLEEIIEQATRDFDVKHVTNDVFKTSVDFAAAQDAHENHSNTSITYELHFSYQNNKLVFESISV